MKTVWTTCIFLVISIPRLMAAEPGDIAPDFNLPGLDGGDEISLSDWRGSVVYLDFWASWCGPCRISLPEMVKLQSALSDAPFTVLAINLDEEPHKGVRFLKRFPVNYPVASNPDGSVAASYNITGMPNSFLIDPEGRVVLAHSGFRPGDMKIIRAHIDELLQSAAE